MNDIYKFLNEISNVETDLKNLRIFLNVIIVQKRNPTISEKQKIKFILTKIKNFAENYIKLFE